MRLRVVVLGAGFGGLELAAILSETLADRLDLTLIDRNDAFVFGFSKLEVLFGRKRLDEVRIPYGDLAKPGVRFRQERITAIDPQARRVTTDVGTHEADVLVVALGADYDVDATPGLAGNEFYSVAGAERLSRAVAAFEKGPAIVGVAGAPFKCPPAPSETALLLHDHLVTRGVRAACEITLVMPVGSPVPPSPDTSLALMNAFAARGIRFLSDRLVRALDAEKKIALISDGTPMPYELFLGVPKHCVPRVVAESGLAPDGWIPVDRNTLATRHPGVYAVGDVTSVGTPKAGVFSESAARVVAASILADLDGGERPAAYGGTGTCYIEFGAGQVGQVEVDFFTGPKPAGRFVEPSLALARDKVRFGATRRGRWFGS